MFNSIVSILHFTLCRQIAKPSTSKSFSQIWQHLWVDSLLCCCCLLDSVEARARHTSVHFNYLCFYWERDTNAVIKFYSLYITCILHNNKLRADRAARAVATKSVPNSSQPWNDTKLELLKLCARARVHQFLFYIVGHRSVCACYAVCVFFCNLRVPVSVFYGASSSYPHQHNVFSSQQQRQYCVVVVFLICCCNICVVCGWTR